jgi:hypothetical protein
MCNNMHTSQLALGVNKRRSLTQYKTDSNKTYTQYLIMLMLQDN